MTDQEKLEKVIKRLGEVYAYFRSSADAMIGGTLACDAFMLYADVAERALTLLKSQEPRVMTFAEVKAHYNLPPVFVDDLDAQEDYYQDISPLYFEFPNPSSWDVHWRSSNQVRTYLEKWEDRYNKTWRCWTSRPDEKRRAETPWK